MLKKVRVFLAVVFFVGITALLLDFSGVLHHFLGWMAKVQFFPAVMACSFAIVAAIVLMVLLFGRWYCSVICPLGVMQDCFNYVGRKLKKHRFHYVKEHWWLRYPVLVLFIVLIVVGLNGLAAVLAPYSAYGRIVSNLLQPLYLWVNNLLAGIAENHESYSFYSVDVWMKSGVSLAVAAGTLLLVGGLALWRGRVWCNNICPVGAVLGLFSRFALFRPVIDADKCKNCRKCEKNCKASCIDIENHKIDYSRCVNCMDCVKKCKYDALQYRSTGFRLNPSVLATESAEKVDTSKRNFLVAGAMVAGAAAVKAQEKHFDGGLAVVEDKQIPKRDVALKPAGSLSLKNFSSHCTGCQLCVSSCPNGVLRPSEKLDTLLQPEMSYERGWCRPECTRCSEVCPAGAIHAISAEEKSGIHIGYAVVVQENCLAWSEGVNCGNCARHCPSEAIVMVPKEQVADPESPDTLLVPAVNADKCLGCGACEYLCPSRPFSAIYVNGRERHC